MGKDRAEHGMALRVGRCIENGFWEEGKGGEFVQWRLVDAGTLVFWWYERRRCTSLAMRMSPFEGGREQ